MSATAPARPADRNAFTVAILCALQLESDAVEVLFDEFWDDRFHYGKAEGDSNSYTLGRMGPHNVVLAYLPGMGKVNSAGVAASFKASFPRIRLGLVVGVCGGVPHSSINGKDIDIFLGDVIVSTSVVQIDLGRQYSDKFIRKDTIHDGLGGLNQELKGFLVKMQGWRARTTLERQIPEYGSQIYSTEGFEGSARPEADTDQLYEETYRHKHQVTGICTVCTRCNGICDPVCEAALSLSCTQTGCDQGKLVTRQHVSSSAKIHFGPMASGDAVMKSATHRERIASQEGVIGFEMEGAGVWNNFPTIVVKGVCDYADSHKNKAWQHHAAAVAAATAKALLHEWRDFDIPTHVAPSQPSVFNTTTSTTTATPASHTQVEGNAGHGIVFNNYGTVGNQTGEQHVTGDMYFDMTQPMNTFGSKFRSGRSTHGDKRFNSEREFR